MFKADSGVLARQCGRLLAASLALLLVSCGGGSTPETLATSSSGSVASKSYGRISGFGSLIVNGVRFDDANTVLTDDSGKPLPKERLGLGMIVNIDGQVDASAVNGVAQRVVLLDEIVAPVRAVDVATGMLTVPGARAYVGSQTVLKGIDSLSALAAHMGEIIEIHGPMGGDGIVMATRLELRGPFAAGMALKGRGILRRFDPVLGHYQIGPDDAPADVCACEIKETGGATVPPGSLVRFWASSAPVPNGVWYADVAIVEGNPTVGSATHVEAEGVWQPQSGALMRGRLGSIEVDLSGLGADRAIAPTAGQLLAVKGSWLNGVLVATRARIQSSAELAQFEFHGPLAQPAGASSANRWSMRGEEVDLTNPLFESGGRAQLMVGAQVDAYGTVVNGTLRVDRIRFRNG